VIKHAERGRKSDGSTKIKSQQYQENPKGKIKVEEETNSANAICGWRECFQRKMRKGSFRAKRGPPFWLTGKKNTKKGETASGSLLNQKSVFGSLLEEPWKRDRLEESFTI